MLSFLRIPLSLALALGVFVSPQSRSADSDPTEVARLKKKLEAARIEIDRLKQENAALKGARFQTNVASPSIAASEGSLVSRAPLQTNDTVEAAQLLNDYRLDPAGADQRYRNQRFKIRGVVDRIDPPFVGLTYSLYLRGPDKFAVLKCSTKTSGITALSMTQDGRTILGEPAFKPRRPLATLGEVTLLEGTCVGIRDHMVHFEKCRPTQ